MSNSRVDLTKTSFHELQVNLLSISYSKYEGDWNSLEHSHKFSELFYITGGKGKFKVDNEILDVKAHDLIIVNPRILHKEISIGDNPLEYIVLGIDGLSFNDDQNHNAYIYHNFNLYKEDVFFYIKKIMHESEKKIKKYEVVCQKLLEILVLNISRITLSKIEVIATKKEYSSDTIEILKYIDLNYRESITLDDISNHLHLSKYYVAHNFKADYGMSPINYLLSKRIDESKILLKTTDLSIGTISDILGFSSQSYFCQHFKKYTNHSPNQYRNYHNQLQSNTPALVYKKINIIKNP